MSWGNSYKYGNYQNWWYAKNRQSTKDYFAIVDKSPHCIQMHYIQDELKKMMSIDNIDIKNYVVVDNELEEITPEIISLSKNLSELKKKNLKNN